MLHLLIPMTFPISCENFVKFNKELQEVCDKYNMGDILVYLGSDKDD